MVLVVFVAAVVGGDVSSDDAAEGADHPVDVGEAVGQSQTDAHHARRAPLVPATSPVDPAGRCGPVDAKQARDVRLGAEAAAADADAVLVPEHRCDEAVVEAFHREGDHANLGRDGIDAGGAVDVHTRHLRQLSQSVSEQPALVGDDARPSDLLQHAGSCFERDGAEQVRSASLLTVGEISPTDLVERHHVDGPATAVFGRGSEAVASTDESTAAEWRVQLVGGQGDEVEMSWVVMRPHVDRAMSGELRRVDEDPSAHGMDVGRQVMDRRDHAGDI